MLLSSTQSQDYSFIRRVIRRALPIFIDDLQPFVYGGNSFTYLLNSSSILKFPRSVQAQNRMHKEVRVANFLKDRLSQVPNMSLNPVDMGGNDPLVFSRAHRIEGVYLSRKAFKKLHPAVQHRLVYQIARILSEVHALPLDRVQELHLPAYDEVIQSARFSSNSFNIFPQACPQIADAFHQTVIHAILPQTTEKKCLVHLDGHPGNFIFTPDYKRVIGIVDWEMAGIGTPTTEFCAASVGAYGRAWIPLMRAYEQTTGHVLDKPLLMRYMGANLVRQVSRNIVKVLNRRDVKTR